MPWQRSPGRLFRAALLVAGLILAIASAETIGYRLERTSPLSRFSESQIGILEKLNHADPAHLSRLREIVVPDRWDSDELIYSPLPHELHGFDSESKAIVIDLAGQVFGAYEYGKLVRWGPVSSGRRSRQTPAGSYHLNWRERRRVSSVDPTWIMPWYFNFDDVLGLGLHEYSLPGRPASHGCVRLLLCDARWIFSWGEPGTPVLVYGRYDFSARQPWLNPEWWVQGVSVPLD
jgi:hypothetical protein